MDENKRTILDIMALSDAGHLRILMENPTYKNAIIIRNKLVQLSQQFAEYAADLVYWKSVFYSHPHCYKITDLTPEYSLELDFAPPNKECGFVISARDHTKTIPIFPSRLKYFTLFADMCVHGIHKEIDFSILDPLVTTSDTVISRNINETIYSHIMHSLESIKRLKGINYLIDPFIGNFDKFSKTYEDQLFKFEYSPTKLWDDPSGELSAYGDSKFLKTEHITKNDIEQHKTQYEYFGCDENE